jgi:hypothetical protein
VRRRRLFSGWLAAFALLVTPAARGEGSPSWRAATSPNFQVFATWDGPELREVTVRLERFRDAILTDCCFGRGVDGPPIGVVFLPSARTLEQALGPRSWGALGPPPQRVVLTYGRASRWLLVRSPLGAERMTLLARAILAGAGGEARTWKPWKLRGRAAYYATAEESADGLRISLGRLNPSAMQAFVQGFNPGTAILERWDGRAERVGKDVDDALEGMAYQRVASELLPPPSVRRTTQDQYGPPGRDLHDLAISPAPVHVAVRPMSAEELSRLLAPFGVSP